MPSNVESFEPYDIIVGPADVWVAETSVAFPAINAEVIDADDDPTKWLYLGYTDGGVQLTHGQDTTEHSVDQLTSPVKSSRTGESLVIEFSLASISMRKYAKIMDNAEVTTVAEVPEEAGPPIVPAVPGTEAFFLERGMTIVQQKLLVRAPSPLGPGIMQYEIPRVAQTGEPQITYVRDAKAVLANQWSAKADLSLPKGERFGRVIAQKVLS